MSLCDPMDCNPLGSSIHRISQARILEWVAIPSFRYLPDPGTEPKSLAFPVSSALQVDSLSLSHQRSPNILHCCCCLVVKSCLTLWSHGLQCCRLPCPSLSPRVGSNLCPLSRWYYPTILSWVTPFSSCSQLFSVSGFFPNELAIHISFIGASVSASVLPMNIQD